MQHIFLPFKAAKDSPKGAIGFRGSVIGKLPVIRRDNIPIVGSNGERTMDGPVACLPVGLHLLEWIELDRVDRAVIDIFNRIGSATLLNAEQRDLDVQPKILRIDGIDPVLIIA